MSSNRYLFVLPPEDVREDKDLRFFEWPADIWLTVVRDIDEDSHSIALFHVDEKAKSVSKLSDGCPVFPKMEGYETLRMSFAEETRVLDIVSGETGLQEMAEAYSRQYASKRLAAEDEGQPSPPSVPAAQQSLDLQDLFPARASENHVFEVTVTRARDTVVFNVGRHWAEKCGLTPSSRILVDPSGLSLALIRDAEQEPTGDSFEDLEIALPETDLPEEVALRIDATPRRIRVLQAAPSGIIVDLATLPVPLPEPKVRLAGIRMKLKTYIWIMFAFAALVGSIGGLAIAGARPVPPQNAAGSGQPSFDDPAYLNGLRDSLLDAPNDQ